MSQDGSSPSAGAPDLPVQTAPADTREVARRTGRWRSWLWAIVIVGIGFGKARAVDDLIHHRVELIAVLGLVLAFAVLRIRLILLAVSTATLVAVCLDPHPWLRGIAVGAGALALLLAVFFTVSTVLHVRQDGRSAG